VEKEYMVVGDLSNQVVFCSCRQFERVGILWSHALKVLDMMNIKLLPHHYVLKRWTPEVRSGTVQDTKGKTVLENPKIEATHRYKSLSRKFLAIASREADYGDIYSFVDDALITLQRDVDSNIKNSSDMATNEPEQQEPFKLFENFAHVKGRKHYYIKSL
jgi:hypothetical protein